MQLHAQDIQLLEVLLSEMPAIFKAVLGDARQPAHGTTEKHNINTRDGITKKTQRE